ncbi:ras-related protein Rab-31 isoform X3 [Balearica regulorum gibbericeps]|uniref:ras-related protein Rab-31 isoform X3 n=1 Tax=Balearica regulorum gibbericeps TaxID=100784 RepID=UPI003F60AAB5
MMAIRELKVCLLGDTGVGKSSIVCRFVQDHFDHNISPTIGASFMTKTVPCGNELHKFLIWDTAGQERFHSLAPMYYRGSAAAVIVYDITKQDSFHTLKKWVKELKEHGPENIVMAIAGNKCDLSDIREVPMKDAKEYAESIGAIVVETSAKNAVNIEELFQGIILGRCSWCWICPRLVFSRELAAGLKHRLQCRGCLVELVCTMTQDRDCPVVGDLLFWLVVN